MSCEIAVLKQRPSMSCETFFTVAWRRRFCSGERGASTISCPVTMFQERRRKRATPSRFFVFQGFTSWSAPMNIS